MSFYGQYPVKGGGSSGGVTTLNGLSGALTLVAGANITITPSGNTLTIASTGGGGSGTVTSFSFTNGGGFTGTVTNPTTTPALSLTGALTGDVTGPLTATVLATVNPNVGSFTNANITVNAKGLITAASNGSAGTFANQSLSNLTSPTAINQNLIFNTGTQATITTADVTSGAADSNILILSTGNVSGTGNGGTLNLNAGSATTGTPGGVFVQAGNNSTTGVKSGAVQISSGQSTSTTVEDDGQLVILTSLSGTITMNSGSGQLRDNTGGLTLDWAAKTLTSSDGQTQLSWFNTYVFTVTAATAEFGSLYIDDVDGNVFKVLGTITGGTQLVMTGQSPPDPAVATLTLNNPQSNSFTNDSTISVSSSNTTLGVRVGSVDDAQSIFGLPRNSADPTTGVYLGGDCYYNITLNKIRMFNGTTWETVTSV